MVMFLFLCPQFSEGWIGWELPGSHSKITLHLCPENRGCDELLMQHRRFTSEGFPFHKHPGRTRLHLFSSKRLHLFSHKEGRKSAKLPYLRKILCWFTPLKVKMSPSFCVGFWNDLVRREIQASM